MNELFLKIINMSISASWLVLAVLLLRFVLKKAPKWVNVLLWGIVAVRLAFPFSIESALSLILFVQCRQDIFVQIAHRWRLRFQLEDALCHIGNDAVTVRINLVFWYVSGHVPCKIIQHSAPPFRFNIIFANIQKTESCRILHKNNASRY